jgi:hypothetical protein
MYEITHSSNADVPVGSSPPNGKLRLNSSTSRIENGAAILSADVLGLCQARSPAITWITARRAFGNSLGFTRNLTRSPCLELLDGVGLLLVVLASTVGTCCHLFGACKRVRAAITTLLTFVLLGFVVVLACTRLYTRFLTRKTWFERLGDCTTCSHGPTDRRKRIAVTRTLHVTGGKR